MAQGNESKRAVDLYVLPPHYLLAMAAIICTEK